MTRSSSGRLAVSLSTAAATVVAGVALLAGPAQADATTALRLSSVAGAAGTCLVVTLQPVDARGVQATDAATATVRLTELPEGPSQDVDFCTTPETTPPASGATYTNAGTAVGPLATPGSTQSYAPGPSVTPNPARPASGGNPDVAADAAGAAPSQTPNSNNPTGVDVAQYGYSGGVVRIGVAGLTAGGARVEAFLDRNSNGTADTGELLTEGRATFSNGGLPGSDAAVEAVRSLDAEPEAASAQQGATTTIPVTLRNGSGDVVAGVTPLLRVGSGPNAAPADQVRSGCGESSNAGVATCTFGGTRTGTDTLQVWVQQAGGTVGPDPSEPQDEITRTTTLAPVDASLARFVELTPSAATTVSGQTRSFRATVTAATGAAVRRAALTATEVGPGQLAATALVTDDTGVATATVLTTAGEAGTQIVKVALDEPSRTQCTQARGAGTGATSGTPAGTCSDSSTHTVAAAPSPPPSTATATVRPVVTLERSTITSQEGVGVRATTFPGAIVELHAYSRPSTRYVVVRRGVATQDGTIGFQVGPSGNTRLFVRTTRVDGSGRQDSESVVLTVRTSINLKVVRTGVRTYRFTGSTLPKRSGQLVTVFYSSGSGSRVIAARARVSAKGTYDVTRRFSGGGTVTLFTATGTDINNAGNESNRLRAVLG